MSSVLPSAIFTLSIDLELDPLKLETGQPRALEAATQRLVKLLDRLRVPATWTVADPAVSAATEVLLAANAGHEIAILGDPTWVGAQAGRTRFGRELNRRVTHAKGAGIEITTLALRGTELNDHLDLAVKQGISVIRADYREVSSGWFARPVPGTPATVRFGLWDVPASMRLPGTSRWKPGGGGRRRARTGIAAAIVNHGVFQIQVDALLLAERGTMAEHTLEQIVRHALSRQQEGFLEIGTLAMVARKLAGERTANPARSILHSAA